ncbi:c2 domain-containing protein [Anaeramoeba ignava]|uniref:C2 domain-containing protein n=1 Tax=Anaeramoeba ignava TaxID=1746090 RepID=A0A9Q0LKF1_ANAIG|nr:c2 domain-containing protein [Anaeramoeba ignava]
MLGTAFGLRKIYISLFHERKKILSDKPKKPLLIGVAKFDILKELRHQLEAPKPFYFIDKWFAVEIQENPKTGANKQVGEINLKLRIEWNPMLNHQIVQAICGFNGANYIPTEIFDPKELNGNQCGVDLLIKKGLDLPPSDLSGLSDPYCIFNFGKSKTEYRTQTCPNTLYPLWRERFKLIGSIEEFKKLELVFMDYDTVTKDDVLGSIKLKFWKLLGENLRQNQSVYIFKKDFDHIKKTDTRKVVGQIHGKVSMIIAIQIPLNFDYNEWAQIVGIQPRFYEPSLEVPQGKWGLIFNVRRAIGIPSTDLNGFSDAYCVIHIGTENLKTKIQFKTLNPIWKESFTFIDDPKELKKIYIDIYDRDKFSKDDRVGDVKIPFADLVSAHPPRNGCSVTFFKEWFQIFDKEKKEHGKILIWFRLEMN